MVWYHRDQKRGHGRYQPFENSTRQHQQLSRPKTLQRRPINEEPNKSHIIHVKHNKVHNYKDTINANLPLPPGALFQRAMASRHANLRPSSRPRQRRALRGQFHRRRGDRRPFSLFSNPKITTTREHRSQRGGITQFFRFVQRRGIRRVRCDGVSPASSGRRLAATRGGARRATRSTRGSPLGG